MPDPIHDLIIDGFAAIDTEAKADRALQLRAEIEGRKAGDLAMLAAVTENLRARIAAHDRELADWDWRYKNRLEEFARTQLRGKQSRTWRSPWGCVSFRKNQGTNKITDMEAALGWMDVRAPFLIKRVEAVNVTDVMDLLQPGEHPPWLESTGPGETIKISTGIEADKEKR